MLINTQDSAVPFMELECQSWLSVLLTAWLENQPRELSSVNTIIVLFYTTDW